MSAWDHFVQRTLAELRNGARIPEYFGCLAAVLSRGASPGMIPNYPPPPPDSDDDFISLDVVKPKAKQSPPKSEPKDRVESLILNSTKNALQAPPPALESESFASQSPPPSPPSPQPSQDVPESEPSFQSDRPRAGYAEYFREIGDMVFGQYWYPITTTIPRMTLESKLMATFKVSKFDRLKTIMLEQARKQTNTSNKLMFSRRAAEPEEEEEYE